MILTVSNMHKDLLNQKTPSDLYDFVKIQKEIGVDIETTGLIPGKDKITTIQFGNEDTQYIMEYSKDLKPLLKLIFSLDLLFIFQNGKFDLNFIYLEIHMYPKNIYDTMIVEKMLHFGLKIPPPANLKYLALKYAKKILKKEIRSILYLGLKDERVLKYSAEDVEVLIPIKRQQEQLVQEANMVKAVDIENRFVKVLSYIERSGIFLNKELWEQKCKEDDKRLASQLDLLNQWVIDNVSKYNLQQYAVSQLDLFNPRPSCSVLWSSPSQVISLFKKIGIDTIISDSKTGELKDSVEASVLISQAEEFSILPIYLKYKELEKTVSTYGRKFYNHINPKTGRIHTKFNQLVRTGRLSSGGSNKKTKEEYINLQNIPSPNSTRKCFTNQYEDTILVSADYSQQEQVIFANRCLDPKLLEFYDNDLGDMHSFIASKIYKIPFEEISKSNEKKDKKEPLTQKDINNLTCRSNAKAAGFAINYGGTGETIAGNLNIPPEEGEEIYKEYFKTFTGIDAYFNKVTNRSIKRGYISINPITGRKFFIDNFETFKHLREVINKEDFWEYYREAKAKNLSSFDTYYSKIVRKYFRFREEIRKKSLNAPIQGTAAEMIKVALILIFEEILKRGLLGIVLISNTVHDEILLETPNKYAKDFQKIVSQKMEKAGLILGCERIKLNASANIVEWWNH